MEFQFHISECVLWQYNMWPNYCTHQEEMKIKKYNDHKISLYVFKNMHQWSKHDFLLYEKMLPVHR